MFSALSASAMAISINPQQLIVDTWSSRDGLPEGGVLALFEDNSGQLWLGTECCITRFDGAQFQLLEHELKHFGQYSFARAIESDGRDGFWVAMVGGVAHYDGREFHWYGPERGLSHPFVYAFEEDSQPWIGTGGDGIWRLVDEQYQRDPQYQGFPGKINDLEVNAFDELLVATDFGLIKRRHNGSWEYLNDTLPASKILITHSGETWIAGDQGLATMNSEGKLHRMESLGSEPLYSLLQDSMGQIWAGGDNTLYRISGDQVQTLHHTLGRSHALLQDSQGNIWVAAARGLMRLKKGPIVTSGLNEGLRQNSLFAIAPHPQGGLWIVDSEGGVGLWDQQTYQELAPPGSIPGSGMLGLTVDEKGTLWLANGTLSRWHQGTWTHFALPDNSAALIEATEDGLWLGQTRGDGKSTIHFINKQLTNELQADTLQEALQSSIPLSLPYPLRHVQRIYPEKNSPIVWIASGGTGLLQHNKDSGATKLFSEDQGLPSNIVYSLLQDREGSLWVLTRAGVARIKNGQVDSFSDMPGVPNRSPVHLHLDSKDRFWITADDGIYVLQRQSLLEHLNTPELPVISRKLTLRDGLRSLVVSWRRNGQAITDGETLYYATTEGLSQIDTHAVSFKEQAPAITIHSVQLGGLRLKDLPVVINNRHEHLEIGFSAPDLKNSHRLEFRSRLIRQGNEQNAPWSSASTSRKIQFTNLAHGQYQFEINGRYAGEPWSKEITRIPIEVQPLLYERPLVQILVISTSVILALLWGAHRLKRAERIENELRKRVQERTAELSQEVETRKQAEKAASDLARDLELRVQERTAELELAEMATRRSEERFALAVKGAEDGIWDWDITLNRLYLSPRWLSIIGYQTADFSANIHQWLSIVHPDDAERLRDIFVFRTDNASFRVEYRMQHKRGHYVWVLTRGVVVRDNEGAPIRAAGSQTDICARKFVEQQLLKRQMEDVVTGLPNRLLFSDRLNQALLQGRQKSSMIAVIFVDIDQFRVINEQYGHEAGDEVLKVYAQRLRDTLRASDSVARVGNDEFAVLMHEVKDENEAHQAAERMRQAMQDPLTIDGKNLSISCSMGVKLGRPGEANAEDFLLDSERALVQAKSSGGARLAHYDTGLEQETKARRILEKELKHGLETEEFVLFYQPLVDSKTNALVGFEALSRWQHPTRGLLSPYHFIGMLEACGLIVPFSQWVLNTACKQARNWQKQFNQEIVISINVPAHQLNNSSFIEEIDQALAREQLKANSICLEIVENSLLESQPVVVENLKKLRDKGIKIAIDDFGTGYSSFSYLERFPVDRVKIDRSFCRSVPENAKVNAILSALLNMIRELDIEPLVEGVETQGQLDYILSQDTPIIQGYYFSRPVPAIECAQFIEHGFPKNRNSD